jgi:DNA-binding transcriptional LysR family regulator
MNHSLGEWMERDVRADLKRLDLNLLVVFDTVYATRNISRAAEQLALTQPTVSNALGRLRELFRDPLFVRAGRGVEPTVKAVQMAPAVHEALAMIGQQLAPEALDLSTYKRHFRLLMADVFEPVVLPPLLRAIADRAPQVTVEVIGVYGTDFVRQLREGLLDLSIHVFPPVTQDLASETLGHAEMVLVARRGHPQIGAKVDVATFLSLPFVVLVPEVRNVVSASVNLAAERIQRREVCTVSRIGAMPSLVERTDLVAMLPRWYFHEVSRNFDLIAREMPVEIQTQPFCLSWHAKNTSDPGHTWLRQTLITAFRDHVRRSAAKPKKKREGR